MQRQTTIIEFEVTIMNYSMVASHAKWPQVDDVIFALSVKAKEASAKYGADKVINSTIGSLRDDNGDLICLKTVYDELRSLPDSSLADYAPLAGQPAFLEAVIDRCFKEYRPDAFIKAVATPGGTGSIRHAAYNYTNPGDSILISDWHWKPYNIIAEEYGRSVLNYELLDDKNNFNMASFKENFEKLLKKQKRIVTVINTPAQNPTGYSLSDSEWEGVLDIVKANAADKDNKIVILIDTAYMDFAGEGDERKSFFKQFSNLPDNVMIIVAYSLSKSYTMYGQRVGAAICITSVKEIAEEFHFSCSHSARANWSNCNKGAMEVMVKITKDANKLRAYEEEISKHKSMLKRRADAFVKASKEAGLDTLPYKDGFFISIPCENSKKISDELVKENIFLVPLKQGLRFAVCAVSEEKCKRAPTIIKKAMA